MTLTPRIAIAWKGLPAYAARLIRAALDVADEPVVLIGTRAAVPVQNLEEILGREVVWIEDAKTYSWKGLGLAEPQLFFQTSWATPAFNSLTAEAKARGAKVVCFHDNNYKGNLRQFVGSIYYRLFLKKRYDAGWVPGSSGRRFCRLMGVADGDIYEGLFSGWSEMFTPGPPLDQRPRRMIFVGQTNVRKAVDVLCPAWRQFHERHPQWELQTFGQGPLQHLLESTPGVTTHPFLQAPEIAAAMRTSRFAIMPSRNDHWPLAIHEAASSGCGLLLSDKVGNQFDLACEANALVFPSGNVAALANALTNAASKSDEWLRRASDESVRRAREYSPERFGRVFVELRDRFIGPPRK